MLLWHALTYAAGTLAAGTPLQRNHDLNNSKMRRMILIYTQGIFERGSVFDLGL